MGLQGLARKLVFELTNMFHSLGMRVVQPDVMTVAKGLTAGYAPMGAVLISDAIYQGIADGTTPGTPMGNGHTYSAHPVSAAIALEVLRLYEEGGVLANGVAQGPRFEAGLQKFMRHPNTMIACEAR